MSLLLTILCNTGIANQLHGMMAEIYLGSYPLASVAEQSCRGSSSCHTCPYRVILHRPALPALVVLEVSGGRAIVLHHGALVEALAVCRRDNIIIFPQVVCRSALGLLTQCALTNLWCSLQAGQVRVMLEAVRVMQQTAGQPSWAMLMGDFNSTPGSAIYR